MYISNGVLSGSGLSDLTIIVGTEYRYLWNSSYHYSNPSPKKKYTCM